MLFNAGKDAMQGSSDVSDELRVGAQHHSVDVLTYQVIVEVALHVLLVLLGLCPSLNVLPECFDILRLARAVALLQQVKENLVEVLLVGAVLVHVKSVYQVEPGEHFWVKPLSCTQHQPGFAEVGGIAGHAEIFPLLGDDAAKVL